MYVAIKPLSNGGVDILPGQEVDVSSWPKRAIDAQLAVKAIRYYEEGESAKTESPKVETVPEKPQTEKPKTADKYTCSECGKTISGQGKTGLCRNCNLTVMRAKKAAKHGDC